MFEFKQWDLSKPEDILRVYCLLRNLDTWTEGPFQEKVSEGIVKLVDRVQTGKIKLDAWKVEGERRDPLKLLKPSAQLMIK